MKAQAIDTPPHDDDQVAFPCRKCGHFIVSQASPTGTLIKCVKCEKTNKKPGIALQSRATAKQIEKIRLSAKRLLVCVLLWPILTLLGGFMFAAAVEAGEPDLGVVLGNLPGAILLFIAIGARRYLGRSPAALIVAWVLPLPTLIIVFNATGALEYLSPVEGGLAILLPAILPYVLLVIMTLIRIKIRARKLVALGPVDTRSEQPDAHVDTRSEQPDAHVEYVEYPAPGDFLDSLLTDNGPVPDDEVLQVAINSAYMKDFWAQFTRLPLGARQDVLKRMAEVSPSFSTAFHSHQAKARTVGTWYFWLGCVLLLVAGLMIWGLLDSFPSRKPGSRASLIAFCLYVLFSLPTLISALLCFGVWRKYRKASTVAASVPAPSGDVPARAPKSPRPATTRSSEPAPVSRQPVPGPEETSPDRATEVRKSIVGRLAMAALVMAIVVLAIYWGFLSDSSGRTDDAGSLSSLKYLTLDLGNGVSMKLVLVPAGTFMMGSPASEEGRYDNEGPQHRVTITKPFYMGIHEVTQEQYETVHGEYFSMHTWKAPRYPADSISWLEASGFCEKLSARTGKTVRLPTEAEWEYACRAGTTTPFNTGHRISGVQGNTYVIHRPDGFRGWIIRGPKLVGSYKPNAWGLHDMHGNVGEWCSDWYQDSYLPAKGGDADADTRDPTGPSSGRHRVHRGGSWLNMPRLCRSAFRKWWNIGEGRHDSIVVGFRVVVECSSGVD